VAVAAWLPVAYPDLTSTTVMLLAAVTLNVCTSVLDCAPLLAVNVLVNVLTD
jgi:hypothetical protein